MPKLNFVKSIVKPCIGDSYECGEMKREHHLSTLGKMKKKEIHTINKIKKSFMVKSASNDQ